MTCLVLYLYLLITRKLAVTNLDNHQHQLEIAAYIFLAIWEIEHQYLYKVKNTTSSEGKSMNNKSIFTSICLNMKPIIMF